MNTPVTFELAKLLKEKEFEFKKEEKYYNPVNGKTIFEDIEPTMAEVIMWLYEKHGIWINVDCDCYGEKWYVKLSVASEKNWNNINKRHEIISGIRNFIIEHNSPTEAYQAAIEYTLTNLI